MEQQAESSITSGNAVVLPAPGRRRGTAVSWLGLLLALLSIIVTLILLLTNYRQFNQLNEQLTALQLQAQHNQIAVQQLTNNNRELQLQVQQQQSILSEVQQLNGGDLAAWRLAEAKYLVQLANYHLSFTHDTFSALTLLQIADQRIASINNPLLTPVRQQLANNIAALQAIPKVDLAGLLTRLTALQIQAGQLPALGLPTSKTIADQPVNSLSPLRQAIHDSWVTLQKIIIIRHDGDEIQPLLSPEQQTYLQQNLQLILQQAQWAVLRREGKVYQTSLAQAQKWVQRYFASNLPATQAFLQALTTLQQINVEPTLPDLTELIKTLQQVNLPANKAVVNN